MELGKITAEVVGLHFCSFPSPPPTLLFLLDFIVAEATYQIDNEYFFQAIQNCSCFFNSPQIKGVFASQSVLLFDIFNKRSYRSLKVPANFFPCFFLHNQTVSYFPSHFLTSWVGFVKGMQAWAIVQTWVFELVILICFNGQQREKDTFGKELISAQSILLKCVRCIILQNCLFFFTDIEEGLRRPPQR